MGMKQRQRHLDNDVQTAQYSNQRSRALTSTTRDLKLRMTVHDPELGRRLQDTDGIAGRR